MTDFAVLNVRPSVIFLSDYQFPVRLGINEI